MNIYILAQNTLFSYSHSNKQTKLVEKHVTALSFHNNKNPF